MMRRHLLLAVITCVVVIGGCTVASNGPTDIPTYRIQDEHNLVLRAQTGAAVFVRLTRVEETAASVVVVVEAVGVPLPSTGSTLTDVPVSLQQPLGQRVVIDGSSGRAVTLLQNPTTE